MPPNIELCGKLSRGAFCSYTIKGEERIITDSEWNKIGRVSMSTKDYGELKKFIIEVCRKSKKCQGEDEELIFEFLEDFDDGF